MIADKDEHIKTILSVIPEKPGCYQYFDENGTIIYVGKAKNLKRRVSSYFNKVHDSNKTRVLVKQIRDIKYIVVDTEEDALPRWKGRFCRPSIIRYSGDDTV